MTLTYQKCWLTASFPQMLERLCKSLYLRAAARNGAKFGKNHLSISLAHEPTQRNWKPQTMFLSYEMRKFHAEFEKLKDRLTWTSMARYLCFNCFFKVTADSGFHFPWRHFQTGERGWRVSYSLCQQKGLMLSRRHDKNYGTFTLGFGIGSIERGPWQREKLGGCPHFPCYVLAHSYPSSYHTKR